MYLHNNLWTSIYFDMERKAEILSLKKNDIILKRKKQKNNLATYSFIFIALFLLCFATNNSYFGVLKESVVKVCNPVSSLYNDNSEVIFTSSNNSEKDTLNLVLPIKASNYEIMADGTIEFVVGNSIMVTSCESGIVLDVGNSLDGKKFIKINHSNNVVTLIENVDMVGVKIGDVLKSGQDVATAKCGDKIYLKIFQNDIQLSNLKISKSKIVWEN